MPEEFSAGFADAVVESVVAETDGVADNAAVGVTVRYVGCELRIDGII